MSEQRVKGYAVDPLPESWFSTGEIVRVQEKGKPNSQWLAQVWHERASGKMDYRPLRLVELPEKDNAS